MFVCECAHVRCEESLCVCQKTFTISVISLIDTLGLGIDQTGVLNSVQ